MVEQYYIMRLTCKCSGAENIKYYYFVSMDDEGMFFKINIKDFVKSRGMEREDYWDYDNYVFDIITESEYFLEML